MSSNISERQQSRMKHRRWIDVALLIVSLYALLSSFWAPPEVLSGGNAYEVGNTSWMFASYALGGGLGLAAFLLVHRSIGLGRILAFAGGIIVLSGFLALRQITPLAVISIGGTALIMIVSGFLIGPMPTPEDEGRPRRGVGS